MPRRFSLKSITQNITKRIEKILTPKAKLDDGREFTKKSVKKRQKLIKKLNKQFTKQLKKEAKTPYYSAGEKVGNVALRRLARKKTMQEAGIPKLELPKGIKTEEDLQRQIARLEERLDPKYSLYKADIYRKNFLTSAKKVFGDDVEEFEKIVSLTNRIDDETFAEAVNQYNELEITFIYNSEDYENKLNELQNILSFLTKSSDETATAQYDTDLKIK